MRRPTLLPLLVLVLAAAVAVLKAAAAPAAAPTSDPTPADLAGLLIPSVQAVFGDRIPKDGLGGVLRAADPITACAPLKNVDKKTPWVALIKRAQKKCEYEDTTFRAQQAGAIAAIVFDFKTDSSTGDENLQLMQPSIANPGTKIPSVFISLQNGDALMVLLQRKKTPLVNVVLQPTRVVAWIGDQKPTALTLAAKAGPIGNITLTGRQVTLSGTSAEIVDRWATTMAGLRPGDTLMIAPQGGVLQVPVGSPLEVTAAIVLAGAPAGAAGSRVAAGAPQGAAVVTCAKGGDQALVIRSPGAILARMGFVGCTRAAVGVERVGRSATGTGGVVYPRERPVLLQQLTFQRHLAMAVDLEVGTAAELTDSLFKDNGGDNRNKLLTNYPQVWAHAGAALAVRNTRFLDNFDSNINFKGDLLTIDNSQFVRAQDTAIRVSYREPPALLYRGSALQPPLFSTARVKGCKFLGNTKTGGPGGAIFLGTNGVLTVSNSTFTNNSADSGGAIFVYDNSWLARMSDVTFENNSALAWGGALFVFSHGCRLLLQKGSTDATSDCVMLIDRITMVNNTAGADGGAMYFESPPDMQTNITDSTFVGNTALGKPTEDVALMWSIETRDRRPCFEPSTTPWGLGGALYFGYQSYGNIFLKQSTFKDNRAQQGGGAMLVCALADSADRWSTLAIEDCSFTSNWAGEANGTAGTTSQGGAVQVLGTYLETLVKGSTFQRNTAGSGGALSWAVSNGELALAPIEVGRLLLQLDYVAPVGWPMERWPLMLKQRKALLADKAAPSKFLDNNAQHGDGGAASVTGRGSVVLFLNTAFVGNMAAKLGGMAALANDRSHLLVIGGVVTNNTATSGGGGGLMARGAGLTATLTGAKFAKNRALSGTSAGGGFVCRSCGNVVLEGASFSGNTAGSLGGGAAIVRSTKNIAVAGCTFQGNQVKAAEEPAATERRRRLLQSEGTIADALAAATAAPPDDMLYPGGGGLYAAAAGTVAIRGTSFVDNTAPNGGGAVVRTDLCKLSPPARCLLLEAGNKITGNTAPSGSGGGLLVSNASLAYTDCGALGVTPLPECWSRANASGPTALAALGLPVGNTAFSPGSQDLASVAAQLVVTCATSAADANTALSLGRTAAGCTGAPGAAVLAPPPEGLVAPPGSTLSVEIAVQDWAGNRVVAGYDANMVLQARPYTASVPGGNWLWTPRTLVLGNTSNTNNGIAQFLGLEVIAAPGEYQLRFTPISSQRIQMRPATLGLRIRNCIAGEANITAQAAGSAALAGALSLAPCQQCRAGTVSLDPQASGGCNRCDDGVHAFCTGVGMIPRDGFWHSHPRSPAIHRCLHAAACRAGARQTELAQWAATHAIWTLTELAPIYEEYVGMQCAEGYQGVLCGECRRGYGRHGQSCVRCGPLAANGFLYFLALTWMAVLIVASAFLHTKQVGQRRNTLQQKDADQRSGFAHAIGTPPLTPKGFKAAAADNPGSLGAAPSGSSSGSPEPGSPMATPFAVPVAASVRDDASVARPDQDGGSEDGAAGGNAAKRSTAQNFTARWRGVGNKFWRSSALASAWSRGTSSGGALTGASRRGSAGTGASSGAGVGIDYGGAAGGKLGKGPLESINSIVGNDKGAAAGLTAAQTALQRRQASRFWMGDVFKLLITHLQLLGLLRTIRMDWPSGFEKVISALDQTQPISSWVVMECVYNNIPGGLRPSLARTLTILLLPAGAALLTLAFWGLRAGLATVRRREEHDVQQTTVWDQYWPRVVMTLGMVNFYLYPQVSGAVVSILFACTPVDDPGRIDASFLPIDPSVNIKTADTAVAPVGVVASALAALKAVGTYWDYDTSMQCWTGEMRWMLALGIVWLLIFCLGFPAAMAVRLATIKRNNLTVDMKFGFFFDSFRAQFYYWESVILLEKLAAVVALTATQRLGAAPQVLAAHLVLFVALLLQFCYHPYACNMLDSLQVASLVSLTGTTIALMAPALNQAMAPGLLGDSSQSVAVVGTAIGIAGFLNIVVVVAFLFILVREARRMLVASLDKDGKGKVTFADIRAALGSVVVQTLLPQTSTFSPLSRAGSGPGPTGTGGTGGSAARRAASVVAPVPAPTTAPALALAPSVAPSPSLAPRPSAGSGAAAAP